MATTNDLKNGLVLNIEGQLWSVVEFQHVKPGKGPAFVRTKLKNVLSGKVVDKTFNAGIKVETANVDKRDMQYLYKDGEDFVFMDTDTYEQMHIPSGTVGEASKYMLENQNATVAIHEGAALYVELPPSVELIISYTEPGLVGDRSTSAPSPRRWRPVPRSRCRCSSPPARRSRWTPVAASTPAGSTTKHLSARSKARRRAVDIVFEADARGLPALEILAQRLDAADPPVREWTDVLVRGVHLNKARIDDLLSTYSVDWPLDRMPAVDRAVLRVALFELLWCAEIPDAVAISEAVEIVTALSTDQSPTFVNGLLGRILDLKPILSV